MGLDARRKQKSLQKKRMKDKGRQKKKGFFSAISDYGAKAYLIRNAKGLPVNECLINPNWKESGLARILLSRKLPSDNFVLGVYLVDILCLGVKNTFCNADVSQADYDRLKAGAYQDDLPVFCHPQLANRIIDGSIEFAKKLGFEPQKDFALSRFVLSEPTEAMTGFDVEFGKDGKPLYIVGPDDDVEMIIRKLAKKVGEGNFRYIDRMS